MKLRQALTRYSMTVPGAGHERAGHSQALAAPRNDGGGPLLDPEMLRQARPSTGAEEPGGMGVIHDQVRSPLLRQVRVPVQGRDVPVHAEEGLGDQEGSAAGMGSRESGSHRLQIPVGMDDLPRPAQTNSVDDAGVVETVRHHPVPGAHEGGKETHVGLVAAGEHQGGFGPLEPGQLLFQQPVVRRVSPQQPGGGCRDGTRLGLVLQTLDQERPQPRIAGQVQVVVGTEIHGLGGRVLEGPVEPGRADPLKTELQFTTESSHGVPASMSCKLLEMPQPVKNSAGTRNSHHLSSDSGVSYNGRKRWRRTQVAKGEVCKTSIHRFESGRRLQLL